MAEYTNIFKALSDKTRIRTINLLCEAKTELCVCEFVDSLEEPQYKISRHLRILKNAEIISERKERRWVYYCLLKGDVLKEAVFKAVCLIPKYLIKKDKRELKKCLKIIARGKCIMGIQKRQLISSGRNYGKK